MNSSKAAMYLPLVSPNITILIPCSGSKSNADENIIGVRMVLSQNGITPGLFQLLQHKLI